MGLTPGTEVYFTEHFYTLGDWIARSLDSIASSLERLRELGDKYDAYSEDKKGVQNRQHAGVLKDPEGCEAPAPRH